MSKPTHAYSHYQQSSLGVSLREALQDMIDGDEISEENAVRTLRLFDQSVNTRLDEISDKNKASFRGHLHTYRNVDNVWTFVLENARVVVDDEVTRVGRLKVIACDGTEHSK